MKPPFPSTPDSKKRDCIGRLYPPVCKPNLPRKAIQSAVANRYVSMLGVGRIYPPITAWDWSEFQ
jgi:hypothetical protein